MGGRPPVEDINDDIGGGGGGAAVCHVVGPGVEPGLLPADGGRVQGVEELAVYVEVDRVPPSNGGDVPGRRGAGDTPLVLQHGVFDVDGEPVAAPPVPPGLPERSPVDAQPLRASVVHPPVDLRYYNLCRTVARARGVEEPLADFLKARQHCAVAELHCHIQAVADVRVVEVGFVRAQLSQRRAEEVPLVPLDVSGGRHVVRDLEDGHGPLVDVLQRPAIRRPGGRHHARRHAVLRLHAPHVAWRTVVNKSASVIHPINFYPVQLYIPLGGDFYTA